MPATELVAICRKIIERYGGKIWVAALAAEGSDFKFKLPKRRPGGASTARRGIGSRRPLIS